MKKLLLALCICLLSMLSTVSHAEDAPSLPALPPNSPQTIIITESVAYLADPETRIAYTGIVPSTGPILVDNLRRGKTVPYPGIPEEMLVNLDTAIEFFYKGGYINPEVIWPEGKKVKSGICRKLIFLELVKRSNTAGKEIKKAEKVLNCYRVEIGIGSVSNTPGDAGIPKSVYLVSLRQLLDIYGARVIWYGSIDYQSIMPSGEDISQNKKLLKIAIEVGPKDNYRKLFFQ